MRDSFFLIAAALLLIMLTASCAGSGAMRNPVQSTVGSQDPAPHGAGRPEVGFPNAIPVDGVQPWEVVDSRGFVVAPNRSAASINAQTDFTPGMERFIAGGDVADNAEASRINGTDASAASYAMYRVSLSGSQPGIVSIDANLLSGKGYYVGISNYGTGRWDWQGPFTDNHIRLQAALTGSDNLLSALGNTFVTVLCPAGSSADLIGVGVNSLDLADALTPAQVTGLSLTPVAGGLELAWAPLLEPDLAGYLVLYSDVPITDPEAGSVRRLPYLEGSTRQLLSGLSSETYVAVCGVDFAGNRSPLGEVPSAVPLIGDAAVVRLLTDAVSAPLNDAITLTASGAASYDWDLDGDGVFELSGDTSGKQQADTTSAGLIRPRVRGTDGEATALGGVSLIITGNTRPVASATADPQSGIAPLSVSFSGEAEDMEDNAAQLSFAWDFNGDGIYEPDTDSLNPDPVDYVDPGLHNAKFRVTDSEGAWDVDTVAIQSIPTDTVNLPPVVAFSFDSQHGNSENGTRSFYMPQGGIVQLFLDATGSMDPEGGSLSYHFDAFGYGEFESQAGAFYTATYAEPGIYKPTLVVEDPDGNTAEASFLIRIYHFSSQELTAHGLNIQSTSMASIGGLPAIVFRDSGTAMYLRALDVQGMNWSEPLAVANTDQGTSEISLLEVDGMPAFAQAFGGNIEFVRAAEEDGSSWGAPITVENHATDSLYYPNMAIVDGRPAIAFYQNTSEKVRYARAGDASGSSWTLKTDVDINVGNQTSFVRLAVVAGRPALIYRDSDAGDLYFLRAEDSTGTDWNSANRVLVTDNCDTYFDLKVADGIPVVAFDRFDPYFCAAANSIGSSWNTPVRIDAFNGGNNHGDYIRLLVMDDHMAVFDYDIADDDIRMSYSGTLGGDSWPSFDILVDGMGDAGRYLGAAVLNGRPAVCYKSGNDNTLRFAWPQLH